MALENDYEVLERLGEGSFGKVYKAKHRHSGDVVAVKQIKLGAKSWDEALKATELAALRTLRHPSIVRLRELLRSQHDGSLYYVFEFIGSDLFRLMRQNPQGLEEPRAAELTRQLFGGLEHIHRNGFFHRDIKPENILFDEPTQTVRIADFGEARSVRARPPFTDYVGTRWYRAPECLLRDRTYSSPVDVWSSGLVFAELLRGSPVFCGTSSIDQLYKIFTVLGQPLSEWPEFTRLAEAMRFRVPDKPGCGLQRVIPRASAQAQGLLSDILNLNPRRRPLARKCLEHNFFAKLPPLDLERPESQRDARSVASTARDPPEERLSTQRTERSCASAACSSAVEEAPPNTLPHLGAVPPPSSTAPTSSRSMAANAAEPSRTPRGSNTSDLVHDDLDLDAELDKILSVGSPTVASVTPARAEPAAGIGLGGAADGRDPALDDCPLEEASLNNANFSFTPMLRQPSPSPSDRMSSRSHASQASRAPPPAAAQDAPSQRPPSPCGGSVEALLDSLCADMGVNAKDPHPLHGADDGLPTRGKSEPVMGSAGRALSDWGKATPVADVALSGGAERSAGSRSSSAARQPESHGGLPPLYAASPDHGGYAPPDRRPSVTGVPKAPSASPPLSRQGSGMTGLSASESLPTPDDVEALVADKVDAIREPAPWTAEEASQLRRIVKKVTRRGAWEKEALWQEVAKELGGCRGPRECKLRYSRDYKARKAEQAEQQRAPGAGQGPEPEFKPLPISAA